MNRLISWNKHPIISGLEMARLPEGSIIKDETKAHFGAVFEFYDGDNVYRSNSIIDVFSYISKLE